MTEFNKRMILDLLNSIYDEVEDEHLLDKLSALMEIIQDLEVAIPIGFIEQRLSEVKVPSLTDVFSSLLDEWDGSEGYVWRCIHGQQ